MAIFTLILEILQKQAGVFSGRVPVFRKTYGMDPQTRCMQTAGCPKCACLIHTKKMRHKHVTDAEKDYFKKLLKKKTQLNDV